VLVGVLGVAGGGVVAAGCMGAEPSLIMEVISPRWQCIPVRSGLFTDARL
jgi:hypothetical protein